MLSDERKHELEHFNEIGQLSSPRARELFAEIDRLRAIVDHYWKRDQLCPTCGWPIRPSGACKCLDEAALAAKENPHAD